MPTIETRVDTLENILRQFIVHTDIAWRRSENEMRAFKDDTQVFKDEMRAFKDDTQVFKDEMRAFKDDTQVFKDEMRAFKD
ncbi:MAG: hypothetical protein ACE5EA_11390, partial [Nitrospirota bacterium]